MKLYEILSKYDDIKKDEIIKTNSYSAIVAAILTHAWVCAKIFSKRENDE